MELTIVIPSHNDTELLVSLLGDVEHLQCAEKVVVVDDGSESPIEAEAISELSGFPATHLEVLRQPVARGAGAARNLGLTRVHTDHMLFLDADDRLTQELPHLMEDLSGQHLDFLPVSVSRHAHGAGSGLGADALGSDVVGTGRVGAWRDVRGT